MTTEGDDGTTDVARLHADGVRCPRCTRAAGVPDHDRLACGACSYRWHPDGAVVFEPSDLAVFAGRFEGASKRLHWDGEALVVERFVDVLERAERTRVEPSADAWRRFWAALDELRAWSWQPEYELPAGPGDDPYEWSLEAGHGERWIRTGGADCFPPDGTGPESNDTWDRLRAAVTELTGVAWPASR